MAWCIGCIGVVLPADQPVGNVNVIFKVVGGSVLLKIVADVHLQLGPGLELLLPVVVGVHVGKGQDLPFLQHVYTVVEAAPAAGSHPDEFWHESGADDGGFLGLNENDGGIRMLGKQALTKEALGHGPAGGKDALGFEPGMYPVHRNLGGSILDAVAGLRIVLDDLASTASALDIQLEEDGAAVPGDAQAVVCDEARDGLRREEGAEEDDEGGVVVGPDGTADDVGGNVAEILRCAQNDRARCPIGSGIKGKEEKL